MAIDRERMRSAGADAADKFRAEQQNPPEKKKGPEKKEKPNNRELLNKAVEKLKQAIETFPKDSPERAQAQHALASVEYALKYLGKKTAPEGQYTVEVEGLDGQVAYKQYEGVPVEDIIFLLKKRAETIKKETTPLKIAELNKTVAELEYEFEKAPTRYEKLEIFKKLDAAKKEYLAAKEEMGKGFPTAKELGDISKQLEDASKTYFEAHYTKEHGEDEGAWLAEERTKQDLRTRHEAHLISKDYRAGGSVEADYKKAMEVMKNRRELDLSVKKEKEVEIPVQPPQQPEKKTDLPPPVPDADPNKPKTPETNPDIPPVPVVVKEPKKDTKEPGQPIVPEGGKEVLPAAPEAVAFVNAEAQVELQARKRGMERLNKRLTQKSWLWRTWTRVWEEGYRQQLIAEERAKILGQEKKPGWIKRKLFGAQTIEATGKQNLFANTGKEAHHDPEASILAKRFAKGYISNLENERREPMEDKEFSGRISQLVQEYADGLMADADFEARRIVLTAEVQKKYPELFKDGGLTVDNLLEAAKDYRKIRQHGEGVAREAISLKVYLGEAKQAVKTQANLNMIDKLIGKAQKYVGPISAETAGFTVAIGSYFAKKPLYWLGGAAGLGGFLGALRKNVDQKRDLEMHRVERAMGNEISDYGPDAKRRQTAERYVYDMEKASDVVLRVDQMQDVFDKNPTPKNAADLVKCLAEAEARHALSETRQKDLLSWDGDTAMEKGRFDFMRAMAEAKVKLKNKGFDSSIATSKDYKDFMSSLGGDMDKIDKSEKWHRWTENAKAAVVGAAGGAVIGGLVQEAAAQVGDHVHALRWLRPGGKETSMEKLAQYTGLAKAKGMSWLNHEALVPSGSGIIETFTTPDGKGVIKVDGTTQLIFNRTTGLYNLVEKAHPSNILADVNVDPITHEAHLVPGTYDPSVLEMQPTVRVPGTSKPITEWMDPSKSNFGKGVSREIWHTIDNLDNNTPLPKVEFNELRLFLNLDDHGNLTIDASKLQEYKENLAFEQTQGSRHGDRVLEVLKAFSEGKIQFGIAPNPDDSTDVLALTLDPTTHKFAASNGSDLLHAFGKDTSGHVIFKGKGFMGTGHILETHADGSKDVEWVNAIRGDDSDIDTGTAEKIINQIGLKSKKPTEWWGPWLFLYRRHALEKANKKESKGTGQDPKDKKDGEYKLYKDIPVFKPYYEKDKEGKIKPHDPQGDHPFDYDWKKERDKAKKYEKVKAKKVITVARGQARKFGEDGKAGSRMEKDFAPDFPEKFTSKTPEEIVKLLLNRKIPIHEDDLKALQTIPPNKVDEYLKESIIAERQVMHERVEKHPRVQEAVQHALEAVDKVFDKYGQKGRNKLTEQYKDKVHLAGMYEFFGEYGSYKPEAMGFCMVMNGEIFVNMTALQNLNEDQLIATIKHTIIHEFTHGTAVNNYWEVQAQDEPISYQPRRTGLQMDRREARAGNQDPKNQPFLVFRERGRALNEAVTETLALEGLEIAWPEAPTQLVAYRSERDVLKLIMKKYDIPFDKFAAAEINREELRRLTEAMEGKKKAGKEVEYEIGGQQVKVKENIRERPEAMSLVMALMDYEFERQNRSYTLTKQFVNGEALILTPDVLASFPKSLLDKNGVLKPELLEAYKNLRVGVLQKAKAA